MNFLEIYIIMGMIFATMKLLFVSEVHDEIEGRVQLLADSYELPTVMVWIIVIGAFGLLWLPLIVLDFVKGDT